jgi:hypothetical protein
LRISRTVGFRENLVAGAGAVIQSAYALASRSISFLLFFSRLVCHSIC